MSNFLSVGSHVNIKRTDGRVHSAIVSGINYDARTVSVEWFEQGQTKGKEVEMDSIAPLNPDVIMERPSSNEATTKAIMDHPRIPQMETHQESSGSSEEEISAHMAHSGHYNHKLDESDDDFNSNQLSPDTTTISHESGSVLTGHNIGTNGSTISSRNTIFEPPARTEITRQSFMEQHQHLREARAESTRHTISDQQYNREIQTQGHTNTRTANGSTASRLVVPEQSSSRVETTTVKSSSTSSVPVNTRRSNVVKEVEKLKKNREERRQRQAEEKAEKEAFLQLAPGNPFWELLNMITEYRRGLEIKPISELDLVEDHLITVCVRKRPLNKREATKKEVDVITIPSKNQLIVHEPKNKVDLTKYLENQLFRFDYAFDETCTNEIVYKYTAQPLIKTIFDGGFATCFAYGQTGSGKTHTMGGEFVGKTQNCNKGIYAMSAADVFKFARSPAYRDLNLIISASFFEIYSGKVFDLLNNKSKLRILEDGKQQVQVVGLTEKVVESSNEVLKLIQKGNQARTSGQTSANPNSSRSHAVFQIILRTITTASKIHGKFSLIDLAGNERGADTSSADRQTRMEGAEINKSLLALKECIRALGRRGAHLPFRVSKLTLVLKDSFIGPNSRTCMIAMISPGISSCEHTLNTLRYADRVKELGAGDLATNQNDDVYQDNKQDDGDLLQLKSLNEHDMTPEMLNFHQVVSELQIAEDNMLENHKEAIDLLLANIEKAKMLLNQSEDVTYDQEGYCNAMASLLDNCSLIIDAAKSAVVNFREKLATEEQLSRETKAK